MRNRSLFARRLSLESLEDRRMMAGDVFARIDRGNLIIRGDDGDNGIQISAGFAPGEVIVLGTQVFGIPTRVNGLEETAVPLTGFNGRIDIVLNGGSDRVRIESFTTRGISADLGRGIENRFELYNHTVNGDLSVKSLEGNDLVIMDQNTVSGSLTIDLGEGSNSLNFNHTSVGRDAKFLAGRGPDNFALLLPNVVGTLFANLGDGENAFNGISVQANRFEYKGGRNREALYFEAGDLNWVTIDACEGNNKVDLHGPRIRRDLRVTSGNGNDEVIGDENDVDGSANIQLGDGNNSLSFQMNVKGDFAVRGGRGMDDVTLRGEYSSTPIVYRSLKVELGDGANSLTANQVSSKGKAEVRGGKNEDAIVWTAATFDSFFADLGSGTNSFSFDFNRVARNLEIRSADGNDTGQISHSTISGNTNLNLGNGTNNLKVFYLEQLGDATIQGGKGIDSANFGPAHFFKSFKYNFGGGANNAFFSNLTVDGRMDINGGDGVDDFYIFASRLGALNMTVAKGDDIVSVADVRTTKKAFFDGGPGDDGFFTGNGAPTIYASLERKGFEKIGMFS